MLPQSKLNPGIMALLFSPHQLIASPPLLDSQFMLVGIPVTRNLKRLNMGNPNNYKLSLKI